MTYADGFGLWHSTAQHRATAKKEIVHELATRMETHNRPYTLVKRDLDRSLKIMRCPVSNTWKEAAN